MTNVMLRFPAGIDHPEVMKACSSILVAVALLSPLLLPANAAEPKKLLVVTTTTGFRHSSIPTAEKILEQLGRDSGEFTVDFVRQPPGAHAGNGFPAKLKNDATPEQKKA